jgi:hypothetical protein
MNAAIILHPTGKPTAIKERSRAIQKKCFEIPA